MLQLSPQQATIFCVKSFFFKVDSKQFVIIAVSPGIEWKSKSFDFTPSFGQNYRTITGTNLTSFRFDVSTVRVTKLISIKSFFYSSTANGTTVFKIIASVFVPAEENLGSNNFAISSF